MKLFQKEPPNRFSFVPLPIRAYERAGGIEHRPIETAFLSRITGGQAYESRPITTTTGREDFIEKGESWASIDTLREDYEAATGCAVSRQSARTAIERLKRDGLIRGARNAFPETRGRYGIIFDINPCINEEIESGSPMVDVVQAHRLFTFGPIDDFRFSAKRIEYDRDKFTRNTYADTKQWTQFVEREGYETAAYKSVGQWPYGSAKEGNANDPVFVPWIIVDIDRPMIPDAYEDTLRAITDFEAFGFTNRTMYIAFSGSKGFHIILSSSPLGFPIFKSSSAAKETLTALVESITDVECDKSTFNPLQVYRISGSRNLKSGMYKTTYTLDDFIRSPLSKVIENAKSPRPWYWPCKMVEAEEDMIEALRKAGNIALSRGVDRPRFARGEGYGRIGPTISKILAGVDESESVTDVHVGRNKAAFILSCFILEDPRQHEQVRSSLGLPNGDEDSEAVAFETLQFWYENRCERGSHGVKLKEPFGSAARRIQKKYGR